MNNDHTQSKDKNSNSLEKLSLFEKLTEQDQNLVNDTINNIQKIYEKTVEDLHYQVGELILSKIFEDNYLDADEINKPQAKHDKVEIFRALEEEIKKRSKSGRLPKKSWLYNAVNLVLDRKLLESVPDYEKLSISHKVMLLTVKDIVRKKELINTVVSPKTPLSVRELKVKIEESSVKKTPGLLTFINNPSNIVDVDSIKLVGGKKKDIAVKTAKENIKSIRSEIKSRNKDLKQLEMLLDKLKKYTPTKGRKKKV